MRYKNTNTDRLPNLVVKNAVIPFSNFAGKEGRFNREGERSFTIKFVDPDLVDKLRADGWNVKDLNPREGYEDDPPAWKLDVKVSYNDKAPHPEVEIVKGENVIPLGEDEIGMLDWAEVDRVDVVVSPFHYNFNGREGISAYLRRIKVWLTGDGLEDGPVDDEPLPFA